MMLIVFLLAMVLDPVGIMLITLPVFTPIVESMGFDPVWFGILFMINMEIGYMTPPFGFNLFYLKGIVPEGITMKDIYRSVVPFVIVEIIGVAIIMVFPSIATFYRICSFKTTSFQTPDVTSLNPTDLLASPRYSRHLTALH